MCIRDRGHAGADDHEHADDDHNRGEQCGAQYDINELHQDECIIGGPCDHTGYSELVIFRVGKFLGLSEDVIADISGDPGTHLGTAVSQQDVPDPSGNGHGPVSYTHLVLEGKGVIRIGEDVLTLDKGEQFFLPAAMDGFTLSGTGGETLKLIRFFGPG